MICTIYGIRLKGDDRVFYVGQTRQRPRDRWRRHMRGRTAVSKALQLFDDIEMFDFFVIEEVQEEELDKRERFWIKEYNTLYPNGLNHTDGGSNGSHSAPARAKMSARMKEVCASPEFKERVGKIRKALWEDPAYRERTTRAIREKRKDPKYLAKISAHMNILWAKPEHRKSISEATKAQWADPEQRAKKSAAISAARKAQLADPEFRAAYSEKQKAAWAKRKAAAGVV